MNSKFVIIVKYVKSKYPGRDVIPLHEPTFIGNEKKNVAETIDSTYVSSVGKFVNEFEQLIAAYVGTRFGVDTVNGTSALHLALHTLGVSCEHEVVTQAFTFIATVNAISYTGAKPIFVDIDDKTLGMSHEHLEDFLRKNCKLKDGKCINRNTGKQIKACIPMHSFGFPCQILAISEICKKWNIFLVEDSTESLGSEYGEKRMGSFGDIGVFSFNGNKIITCGGGGAIVTNNEKLALHAKHLSTQAKVDHPWQYEHDHTGFNYRMPNINAALLCAQLENLELFVQKKRELARDYQIFFNSNSITYIKESSHSRANYWLNTIVFNDIKERNSFLHYSNSKGVLCRPAWNLMSDLSMFKNCQTDRLINSRKMFERIVNIPSSVPS